ncbi:GGDEF domain-containing protein [Ahrensia sp. R2A130]|uniref:GGDEF domain-containing protein n=1 Tax=Ahrensia sp. R2A130 TaxID=744979 RepID=UPI0001E0BC4F|nr:GGDEF domain-containing protein [Ahrensia sp. R2A130]EFL90769.1 diguanylate cyclase [Ahrensia sp. R2A130]
MAGSLAFPGFSKSAERMKRSQDAIFWIYAIGAAGSLLLAASFWALQSLQNIIFLGLTGEQISLILALVTLLFGLVVALPELRSKAKFSEELSGRTAELEVAVVTDPLTKLYNRRYFEDALNEYLAEFTKIGAPLAVLSLDLDHFKSVNDTYGHDAGDVVLKRLAENLQGLIREHDIVARTGGEEFCIVAPFANPAQIRPFAERICRHVGEMRVDIGNVVLRPTISIGVASTVDGVSNVKELLKLSDHRLYLAKEQGRNRVAA